MNFNEAIEYVLKYEGGYINHKDDPGGETNFGISKKAYPTLDIKNLTKAKAKAIYKRDYWLASKSEMLPHEIRLLVLDSCVNHGVTQGIKFLQRSVGADQDGVFGPMTLAKVKSTPVILILDNYAKARMDFFTKLKTWATFGRGWAKRTLDVSLVCAYSLSKSEINLS